MTTLTRDEIYRQGEAMTALEESVDGQTDLYHYGYFDGSIGLEPEKPQEQAYWQGWCNGKRALVLKERNIHIEDEF